ncbi:MAG: methyltransferase domain-containing protein, partial [Acidobacteriota bacterium]|nr:methyltransferase domain-containing protein [Acidobacteriota bacterium]
KRGVDNVEWRQGEIEQLPVDEGAAELALLSQALHHAVDPAQAMREAVRVVVGSGRVLVLDLLAHEVAWTQERLGDRWLGFSPADLTGLMTDAGLIDIQVRPVTDDRAQASFDVVAAIGTKPTTG